jgi:hypothetical protein
MLVNNNNFIITIIIIINVRHRGTVICYHHHYIDGGGCCVHHGHDSCYGNSVHVSDGNSTNGGFVVLVLPPPQHGSDEYALSGVEHG